jgi:signal transduction histidine kinase
VPETTTTKSLSVLLVEDNPGDARLVEHHLDGPAVTEVFDEIDLTAVETLAAGLGALDDATYDVCFLDLGLGETSGLATLDRVLDAEPDTPIVVLTGLDDRDTAIDAIQRGAQDYLPKGDLDGGQLSRALRYAMERHRQEQELKRQNSRLDRFADVVSHDLRNPLSIAQMYLSEVASRTDAEADDAIETVETNLHRMENIIDDVLTLAREGTVVEEPEPVPLGDVVAESWAGVATGDASLAVETDATVQGNRRRLLHLFENLFRNAVEHGTSSPPSESYEDNGLERPGVPVSQTGTEGACDGGTDGVTVRVADLDDGFSVEDDGPGIPVEDREAVFDAGFTSEPDGTGFGLNIVHEIADAHGWSVTVGEGEEGGARFEFHT